jgi:hypothetical protein
VTAATIIPVLFLALVLEGGLWKWIQEQVSDASDPPIAVRTFVSLLQSFAVFVLMAGAAGEMTALYALWQTDYSSILSDIVFSATALLVVLLTVELTAQIPGLLLVSFSTIELRLRADEQLRWSGVSRRSTRFPRPFNVGKLFVTDKRLVWVMPKAAGLLGPPRVEIHSKDLSAVRDGGEKPMPRTGRWFSSILSNFLSPPARHRVIAISSSGRKYSFFPYEYSEAIRYLRQLLPEEDGEQRGGYSPRG